MIIFLLNSYTITASGAGQLAIAGFPWTIWFDSTDNQQGAVAPGLWFDAS